MNAQAPPRAAKDPAAIFHSCTISILWVEPRTRRPTSILAVNKPNSCNPEQRRGIPGQKPVRASPQVGRDHPRFVCHYDYLGNRSASLSSSCYCGHDRQSLQERLTKKKSPCNEQLLLSLAKLWTNGHQQGAVRAFFKGAKRRLRVIRTRT